MKKHILAITIFLCAQALHNCDAYGQAKIKAYFNHPVNNSVSTGINAVYLPSGTMSDTIVAYINRAKYTVDIAQYDYNQSTNDGAYANIATAVNNAYLRGVTVRWIYDGSSSNSGLSALNSGIHTLPRPSNSSGYIMHNKFVIIDAHSTNPNDAILSTGSEDWSSEMFYDDYNNILFIQDSALANAYTAEFNMMWGSTTAVPNAGAAKFGTAKTAIGQNTFTIAGHLVELYFSPSDNPDSHIASTILTANKDLYVGVYDMTRTGDANNIITAKNNGAYTLALVDQYTTTPAPTAVNTILSALGSNYVVYTGSYIYHNKMMIVDPSDTCSDPIVETGSENWTSSGTNYNDENILIIHNDTLANIYYQSFIENFTTIGGGSVTPVAGCGTVTSVQAISSVENIVSVYPNPATSALTISGQDLIKTITISNLLGQTLNTYEFNTQQVQINIADLPKGVYFIKINGTQVRKFVKE